ncbi:EthD family reductase [Bradyrhizobium sp. SSUT18]|uniref:EthD family reductase n=1 Tax=Bradyrhizobium sp. SSUT18 TaxID=3040602 RepID=UPI00244831F7|nr:EthD family reductase [Bradyrhizobium sp. SSUT18]MDH2403732.1 EthD family reductase [Bradyrhizobium sp. SSUT18]
METLLVLYPTQPNPDAFKAHYVQNHIPLVRKLPGLRAFRYGFDVASLAGDATFFCVFEGEFADGEALRAAMGSPEGRSVAEDVPKFAQVPPIILRYLASTTSDSGANPTSL